MFNSPQAAFLMIGNELLSGKVSDLNLAPLAQALGDYGIRLGEVRMVLDREQDIIAALNQLRVKYKYVFTSGGIGPTHDDITALAVAKALSLPLVVHDGAVSRMRQHYQDGEINDARLKMATIPQGAQLIDNAVDWGSGFQIANVYVLAGVPKIFRATLNELLSKFERDNKILSMELCTKSSESSIAQDLSAVQSKHPQVEIGSYPQTQGVLKLVVSSCDKSQIEEALSSIKSMLRLNNKEII